MLQRLSHVCLGSEDSEELTRFVDRSLGLRRARHSNQQTNFVLEPHTLVLGIKQGGRDDIGLELGHESDLEKIASRIQAYGRTSKQLGKAELLDSGARQGIEVEDPSGNRLLLLVGSQQTGRPCQSGQTHWLTHLCGVGLCCTALQDDVDFWTKVLDARVRDRVGDVTFLAIDDAHHRVALYPSDRSGVLYTSFAIPNVDALMRNYYILSDNKIDILQGPGKETVSGNLFIRFAGPDGQVFSLVKEESNIDWENHEARCLPLAPLSFCELGAPLERIPEFVRGMEKLK